MFELAGAPVGGRNPFVLLAGPCVIESEDLCMEIAEKMVGITQRLGIPYAFKASFDKANRTSHLSYRGPGVERGLAILSAVRSRFDVPIVTDVHEDSPIEEVASVVDVIQTPAFLCRQTNFIQRVAATGKVVNIKKGQFLSPWEMLKVGEKACAVGNARVMLCERGTSFGYHNLVVDMRGLAVMRQSGLPIVFDATHCVQQPGALGDATGGAREFIPVLARAAVASGVSGLFMETHPRPDEAKSDGPNSWPLDSMEALLAQLVQIDTLVKTQSWLEESVNIKR